MDSEQQTQNETTPSEVLKVQRKTKPVDSAEQLQVYFDPEVPVRPWSIPCQQCQHTMKTGLSCQDQRPYEQTSKHHESYSALKISALSGCIICSRSLDAAPYKSADARHVGTATTYVYDDDITLYLEVLYAKEALSSAYDELNEAAPSCLTFGVTLYRELSPPLYHSVHDYDSPNPNTRDSLPLCKLWFQNCINLHRPCRPTTTNFIPTRLIALDDNKPRICVSHELRDPIIQYATLSHRWGLEDFITLTKSNLDEFCHRIPPQVLTKTFQDALDICNYLGIKYLWIDSFCIVQDSSQDWEQESAMMTQVYGGGVLNIAATSANNGTEGCFFDRTKSWISRIPHKISGYETKAYHCVNLNSGQPRNALKGRGWLVQEHHLSTRTLHFTDSQVFWECIQQTCCEQYVAGIPDNKIRPTIYYDFSMKTSIDRSKWLHLLQQYVRTDLTQSKDRLVAIGGLAQEIQKKTKEEYVAGFWRGEIDNVLCLTWMCSSRGASISLGTSPSSGAKNDASSNPSWSWAYIVKTPELTLEWPRMRRTIRLVQVHDLKYEYATPNRFGDVKNAILRLRCKILSQALVSRQPHHERQHTIIMGGHECLNVAVEWDLAGEVLSDEQMITVHILAVWSSEADHFEEEKGLLLQPTGERQGQYHRLGVYSETYDGQSFTAACESAHVTQQHHDLFSEVYIDRTSQKHYIIDLV